MLEATAPDGTEFLALTGELDPTETYSMFYLIEAPKTCRARQVLERGEISWFDYWSHKGWLLVMNVLFCKDGDALASYSKVQDLPPDEISFLKNLGTVSPYDLKYNSLAAVLEYDIEFKKLGASDIDVERSERRYTEFVTKYAHKISSLKSVA